MKLLHTRLTPLLALAAGALLLTPSAPAATSANGDIFLGVRATSGTGSTKTFVINLGQASQFETATSTLNVTNIGTDLTNTFGAGWDTRPAVSWGVAGTIGSFTPIGSDPAKTVFGSRALQSPWGRQNDASQGAATNKIRALTSAFNTSSSAGVSASNAVVQLTTDTNNWASFQPGGANAGPAPGYSFAFFNPHIEASFGGGAASASLSFYRVKPATTAGEIDAPSDFLGTFAINSSGAVTFTPSIAQLGGTIAFSEATYSVDQGSSTVALTVTRTDGGAPTSVTIHTMDGTANSVPPFSPAVAGTDYTALSGADTTVSFAQDETSKVVNVDLDPNTAANVPNKRFSVTLSSPTGSATLGTISTTSVQILGASSSSPALKITTPARVVDSASVPYTVAGTAGAALGVDRVEVSLNGAPAEVATLGAATTNTSIPWSLEIAPLSGINTIVATVYDLSGNSASVRRLFTFTRRYVLTIARSVPAAVSGTPDKAGTVTMAATPSSHASLLSPTAASADPKTTTIVPGTTVKLTATAKAGYVFSEWSGLPSGATVVGNVATFTMPAEDPSVTAAFVDNPFAATGGASTNFYGLVHASGATAVSNATEGFFTGSLTAGTGGFSGKVLIDGVSKAFSATFYGNGSALFSVGTSKSGTLDVGGKSMTLSYASDVITATITAGSDVSTGTATRGIYSSSNHIPAGLQNSGTSGFFTIGFPAKAQTPPQATSTYPQGDGYATMTVSSTGLVSVLGYLADGSSVSGSSALTAGNVCPLFVQVTTPGAAVSVKGGSFGGTLTFDTTPADSDVSGTDLLWIRPTVTAVTSPAAKAAATNLYTDGWPNGIRVDAVGALYSKSTTVQAGLGIGASNPTQGNADLDFASGKLTSAITKSNFNIVNNTVTKIPASDSSFTLILAATTGGFSGSFTPNWASPATTKPAYKGILIQKGANKGGFGYFLSNASGDLDPQSGSVTLSKR